MKPSDFKDYDYQAEDREYRHKQELAGKFNEGYQRGHLRGKIVTAKAILEQLKEAQDDPEQIRSLIERLSNTVDRHNPAKKP
jgi:hypothetical protein